MYAYELCRKYLDAANRKDLPAVLDLFAPDSTIRAPIQGILDVKEFHVRLFRPQTQAIAKLKNIFDGFGELSKTRSIALQFSYTWILGTGKALTIDGMTVFELDERLKKFKEMLIIYDPTVLRMHLQEVSSDGLVFHSSP